MRVERLSALVLACAFIMLAADCSKTPSGPDGGGGANAKPNFASIQTEVFDQNCSCHQTTFPSAMLDLTSGNAYASLVKVAVQNDAAAKRFKYRVDPGQPDSSFLMAKLTNDLRQDEGDQMPQRGVQLSQNAIDAIRTWIANGAANN